MIRRLLPAIALFSATACGPTLSGFSSAAPGLTLRHEYNLFADDVVTLSEGSAYALACFTMDGGCDSVRAVSSDPKVAEVLKSHMERRIDWYGEMRTAPARPGFVITGMSPGETTITFTDSDGQTTLRVVVE